MAPSNPKSRPRGAAPAAPGPRRAPTLELPFNDEEVQPLRADDPRPQRVAQYPSNPRRPARKVEEAIPTSIYDVSQDEEFQPSYDNRDVSDSGYRPAFLYVERGPGAGQLVPVHQGGMVMGRASVSELRLQHPSISRRHAQITRLGERFYIKDLGSQNGTFVNRTRIATEVEVHPGDEVSVGNALLKLRGPVQAAEAPAFVPSIQERRSKVPQRKRSNAVRVGLVGGALGFLIAAVFVFAALKIFPREFGLRRAIAEALMRIRAPEAIGELVGLLEKEPGVAPTKSGRYGVRIVEPILDAMGIAHHLLETDDDVPIIPEAIDRAYTQSKPVVMMLGRRPTP